MEVFIFLITRAILLCCLLALVYVIAPQKDLQDQLEEWDKYRD
ncbi:hypothetical protein [Mucilaginibacter flavus]|nr:hypothetical protein [Mucilaginibacter flavus]MDN3584543.1 hypothetical protein [Mucilaginibacter flavus]